MLMYVFGAVSGGGASSISPFTTVVTSDLRTVVGFGGALKRRFSLGTNLGSKQAINSCLHLTH